MTTGYCAIKELAFYVYNGAMWRSGQKIGISGKITRIRTLCSSVEPLASAFALRYFSLLGCTYEYLTIDSDGYL